MKNNKALIVTVAAFILLSHRPAFAQEGISEYLCDIGEGYYLKGQYSDALHEFNKALMVNPDSLTAKSYIRKIDLRLKSRMPREIAPAIKETVKPAIKKVVPEKLEPKKEILPKKKIVPLDKAREPSIESAYGVKKAKPLGKTEETRKYLPSKTKQEQVVEKKPVKKEEVRPVLSKVQVVDLALAKFEKELGVREIQPMQRERPTDKATERFSGEKEAKEEAGPQGFKVSGVYQIALGGTSDGFEWKRANGNLNERDYRVLSDAALNNRENTFDPRIFDRFRIALDTLNPEGLNVHTNITIDPWSFTGKSEKFTVTSANGTDTAEVELKYWSNTGRTYNDIVYTAKNGDSFALPEIKVEDFKTSPTTVSTLFGGTFDIPSKKIDREFQPMRELWFDYKQDTFKFRFFPLALGNQALTSDDPLMLSNHAVYWEESPWLLQWDPGHLNNSDFSRGRWSDSLAFNTRDSDLVRLTALRGFSFDYFPSDETSFKLTGASPKGLWQDYDSFDNIPAAARFKQKIGDSLQIGNTYTFRMGLNEDKGNKMDALNHAGGLDLAFSPVLGAKMESEIAISESKQDLTSSEYKSRERGMAYHLALIGSPDRDILESSYNQINPKESDTSFLKARFQFTHMDKGFEPVLSSYRESRDDQFWSRHIHFRKPFAKFYGDADISGEPSLSWYDIAPYAIGDGIDTGRDVIGFRVEMSNFDRRLDELFDARNVHRTGGKYLENVARSETTYKATDKLTTKLLTIYHDVHSTYGKKDPYLVDSQTDRYFDNANMPDGVSPSMKTVSLGANYDFFEWLSTYGIWEYSNDINGAYGAFGRGLLNSSSFETFSEYGKTYRRQTAFVYNQQYFPLPPYPFNNSYKFGLTLRPAERLEIFLDYTRNEYKYAGQISDDMNHAGIEIGFYPSKRWGIFTKYAFSQVNDLVRMNTGEGVFYENHHNFFLESRFSFSADDQFTFQFGEFGRSPIASLFTDPFGGSSGVLDTQYIYRLYYRRKF